LTVVTSSPKLGILTTKWMKRGTPPSIFPRVPVTSSQPSLLIMPARINISDERGVVLMVIQTVEEILQRLKEGWSFSRKGKYLYMQKWDSEHKTTRTEKIANDLVPIALKIWEEQRAKILENKEKMRKEMTAAKIEDKMSQKIVSSVTQRVAQTIDIQTRWILEWGTWVANKVLPLADGNTFAERARKVNQLLEAMLEAFPHVQELMTELEKLKKENELLRDVIRTLKEQLSVHVTIRQAIVEAIRSGDRDLVESLMNKYLALVTKQQSVLRELEVMGYA